MGASTEKGKLVFGISIIAYILILTLKNLPVDKGMLALVVTGISMVLGSLYFKYIKKELCTFWGISTWIYGILFLILALFRILS